MQINKQIMEKAGERGESVFHKLEAGENKFRVVSEIQGVREHSLVFKREEGKYKFPICPKAQQIWINDSYGESVEIPKCPICSAGIKDGEDRGVKTKYFVMAINRKSGKLGVLKSGKMIFNQIMALNSDEDYGDVKEYDIKINRVGEGLETKYTVLPSPKKVALTDKEKAEIENSDIDVNLMAIPNDYEKLIEIGGLEGVSKEVLDEEIPFD